MKQLITLIVAMAATFSLSSAVAAEQPITVRIDAQQEVEVVNELGEKEIKKIAADKVLPGDEVVYTIYVNNTGEDAASNIVITDPVPEHMSYVEGSASNDNTVVVFSIDGGINFDAPENLKVKSETGELEAASAKDYTHVQWRFQIEIAGQSSKAVSFKARLN